MLISPDFPDSMDRPDRIDFPDMESLPRRTPPMGDSNTELTSVENSDASSSRVTSKGRGGVSPLREDARG